MSRQISVMDKYIDHRKKADKASTYNRDLLGRWNSFRLNLFHIYMSPLDRFNYLIECKFINNSQVRCLKCKGSNLTLQSNRSKKDGCVYQCNNDVLVNEIDSSTELPSDQDIEEFLATKPCDGTRSVRTYTWFSGSNLAIGEILYFTYYWWYDVPSNFIFQEMKFSSHTRCDWAAFCREVAIYCVMADPKPLGGTDMTVEIDESVFSKRRKYGRGRVVPEKWVFGGVERGTGRCFLVPVKNRKRETLMEVIRTWILPGTRIISDCWAAYNKIDQEDFLHKKVNHTYNFVDPDDPEVHTQNIEVTWSHVKNKLPDHNRASHHTLGYLAVFMLKRMWKSEPNADVDGFVRFMQAAAELFKDRNGLDPFDITGWRHCFPAPEFDEEPDTPSTDLPAEEANLLSAETTPEEPEILFADPTIEEQPTSMPPRGQIRKPSDDQQAGQPIKRRGRPRKNSKKVQNELPTSASMDLQQESSSGSTPTKLPDGKDGAPVLRRGRSRNKI